MNNLPKDPFMLMSMVNMRLRDNNETLDEFCAGEGIDRKALEEKLRESGFEYIPEINQFR